MFISKKSLVLSAILLALIYFQFNAQRAYAWHFSASNALVCDTLADVQVNGFRCIEGITDSVFNGVISLIVIGMFVMLIVGGMKYVTAGGDQKAVDSAKKTITYAVMGAAMALAAYFLLNVLGNALGLPNLLRFELPIPTA